ncbi:hypothetical protein JXR01_02410 [Candidatus Kaiserbacteria bacterium]|nr:MAG: hypothetical protein JXR01_02410 [Candidatus Kaiserbacteria bacterium]
MPEKLPKTMQSAVEELQNSSSQKECLARAYELMTTKYHGNRIKTYALLARVFTRNIFKLWERGGFVHCTNANYVLRILLVKSGFFKNEDIQSKWTLVWYISPHQYLEVTMQNGECINVDVWSAAYGLKLGEYVGGFN